MEDKRLKLTPKRIEICHRLNLYTTDDVLCYYPYRYEVNQAVPFENWKEKDKVTFEGTVISNVRTVYKGKMSICYFDVMYEEVNIRITVFNRPWARNLKSGSTVTVQGVYQGSRKVVASNYDEKKLSDHPKIQPIYSVKEGITQKTVQAIITKVFEAVENEIDDDIPEEFIRKYRLLRKRDALYRIHFPSSTKDVDLAVRTLKYSEFLRFFTAVTYNRHMDEGNLSKPVRIFDTKLIKEKISKLPYRLTQGQLDALNDILKDMASSKPMYRLVQGDVGCGKTSVAVFAMYAAVLSGYQAALLAPTEILARQHYTSIQSMLGNDVKVGLLYSGLKNDEKNAVMEKIRNGEVDIIVGTHALLQENVQFDKLGLVITDEQQRFGVNQRRTLVQKGETCDVLCMSATPIPRTLAGAMFGDMNISTIHTLPAGRKEPVTTVINENSFRSVLNDVKQLLSSGHQLYIICAAVEENEANVRNVETVKNNVSKLFPQYTVASLIGPMKSEEKEAVMKEFADNKAQILVSTTVVEVGMNVVNATGMIIYNAERFGLSQLHQLRGRIQRGNEVGHCWVLSDAKEEHTLKRLQVLEKTNDGFVISQEDLRQRGPGDILGTRQSGIPDFILGNMEQDTNIMETARKDSLYICEHPDYPAYAKILDVSRAYSTQYMD